MKKALKVEELFGNLMEGQNHNMVRVVPCLNWPLLMDDVAGPLALLLFGSSLFCLCCFKVSNLFYQLYHIDDEEPNHEFLPHSLPVIPPAVDPQYPRNMVNCLMMAESSRRESRAQIHQPQSPTVPPSPPKPSPRVSRNAGSRARNYPPSPERRCRTASTSPGGPARIHRRSHTRQCTSDPDFRHSRRNVWRPRVPTNRDVSDFDDLEYERRARLDEDQRVQQTIRYFVPDSRWRGETRLRRDEDAFYTPKRTNPSRFGSIRVSECSFYDDNPASVFGAPPFHRLLSSPFDEKLLRMQQRAHEDDQEEFMMTPSLPQPSDFEEEQRSSTEIIPPPSRFRELI